MRKKTIAEELNSQLVGPVQGATVYDPNTLIFTFEDGSQAKILTTFEDCKPYQTQFTTTSSKKEIKKWMAI